MAIKHLNLINKIHRRPLRGARLNVYGSTDSIFIHNVETESSLVIEPITIKTANGTTFDEASRIVATLYVAQNNYESFIGDLINLSRNRNGCNCQIMLGDMSGFDSDYNAGLAAQNYEGGALLELVSPEAGLSDLERWGISIRFESPEFRQRLIVTCTVVTFTSNIFFNGTL